MRLDRRDDDDLILESAARAEAEDEALSMASRLFCSLVKDDDGARALLMALPDVFPCVQFLPTEDVQAFLVELVKTLRASADLGNMAALEPVVAALIPAEFRPSGIDQPLRSGLPNMLRAWHEDEFVLDPSRISLYIGLTGIDGATFKREQLMDKFGIQINKTSRNTMLFMTNIDTTRSAVATSSRCWSRSSAAWKTAPWR